MTLHKKRFKIIKTGHFFIEVNYYFLDRKLIIEIYINLRPNSIF